MAETIRFRADTGYLRSVFKRLRKAGESPKPLLEKFGGKYMRRIPQRSVQEQRSPSGLRPWEPITRGPRAGKPALRDTGTLVKAFLNGRVQASSNSVGVTPQPNLKRFWIHQTGGVLRPTRAKYLALPLTAEARKAGSARKWWSRAQSDGKKPFIFTSRNGHKFIAYKRKNTGLELVFLLKDSVKIPARPFLGFGRRDRDEFVRYVSEYLQAALRGSSRGGSIGG